VASTILPVICGGIAGSLVTYGLTWVRERRRNDGAYRAPQRIAIGDIVAATHELTLHVHAFRDVCDEFTRRTEGREFREISEAELNEVSNQTRRALLGVGRAFHVGRLTIVDAECFEAMGMRSATSPSSRPCCRGSGNRRPTQTISGRKPRALCRSLRDSIGTLSRW
jgi:hypothetical protein